MSLKLSAQVGNFRLKALAKVDKVRRGGAIRLFSEVVERSPVDTGRLRANWRCSVNITDRSTDDSTDQTGVDVISKLTEIIGNSKLTDTVIFSNSLPYAHRIEYDGWSHTKAPAGMVRVSIARFNSIMEEQKQQVRNE